MSAKTSAASKPGAAHTGEPEGRSADGHALLGGARWHYPAPGRPFECAVPGCDRVLGQTEAEPSDGGESPVDGDGR